MNVWGVTFGGYLAKILSFKSGNLLYKSNFYLLSEATVKWCLYKKFHRIALVIAAKSIDDLSGTPGQSRESRLV